MLREHHTESSPIEPNTLIATGSGSALLGASFFGIPGAVAGAIFGIGIGYLSEVASHRDKQKAKKLTKKSSHHTLPQ